MSDRPDPINFDDVTVGQWIVGLLIFGALMFLLASL